MIVAFASASEFCCVVANPRTHQQRKPFLSPSSDRNEIFSSHCKFLLHCLFGYALNSRVSMGLCLELGLVCFFKGLSLLAEPHLSICERRKLLFTSLAGLCSVISRFSTNLGFVFNAHFKRIQSFSFSNDFGLFFVLQKEVFDLFILRKFILHQAKGISSRITIVFYLLLQGSLISL